MARILKTILTVFVLLPTKMILVKAITFWTVATNRTIFGKEIGQTNNLIKIVQNTIHFQILTKIVSLAF